MDMKPFEASETYSEPFVRELPLLDGIIALRSPYGTGTTRAAIEWLERMDPNTSMLWISETTPPSNVHGRPWVQHDSITDKDVDIEKYTRLVIPFEALLRFNLGSEFGMAVVLDDMPFGKMHMYVNSSSDELCVILLRSKHVLLMDPCLNGDIVHFLGKIGGRKPHVISNETGNTLNVKTTSDMAQAISYIIQKLKGGHRVHCPCFTLHTAETVALIMMNHFKGSKKVLLATATSSDWDDADIVVHPSEVPTKINLPFTTCCCFAANYVLGFYPQTAVKMIAGMDRMTELIICVESIKFDPLIISKQEILDEFDKAELKTTTARWFGSVNYWEYRVVTLDRCSPHVWAALVSKQLENKTRMDFERELSVLLVRDSPLIHDVGDASMKQITLEIKQYDSKKGISVLSKIYNNQRGVFTQMTSDKLGLFRMPFVMHAFSNQCIMRSQGSLENLKPDYKLATEALQLATGYETPVHAIYQHVFVRNTKPDIKRFQQVYSEFMDIHKSLKHIDSFKMPSPENKLAYLVVGLKNILEIFYGLRLFKTTKYYPYEGDKGDFLYEIQMGCFTDSKDPMVPQLPPWAKYVPERKTVD